LTGESRFSILHTYKNQIPVMARFLMDAGRGAAPAGHSVIILLFNFSDLIPARVRQKIGDKLEAASFAAGQSTGGGQIPGAFH
jgi:hypothetical protein